MKKNCRGFIPIFFCILLLLTFPGFTTNVMAVDYGEYDFEDGVVGNDYDNGVISTFNISGTAYEVAQPGGIISGKAIWNVEADGYLNFSYASDNMTNWSCQYAWRYQFGANDKYEYHFRNSADEDIIVIRWRYNGATGKVESHYMDHNGVYQAIFLLNGAGFPTETVNFSWRFNGNNQVEYHNGGTGGVPDVIAYGSFYGYDRYSDFGIKNCYIDYTVGTCTNVEYYMDNMTFSTGNINNTVDGGTGSYSSYCVGEDEFVYISNIRNRYIEDVIPIVFNGYVSIIDLYVDANQLSISSSMSDYTLYLNGNDFGNPELISIGENNYILRWSGTSLYIENEVLLFEFDSATASNDVYWDGLGITDGSHYEHSNSDFYGDGQYSGLPKNYDLKICIYYNSADVEDNCDVDGIWTLPIDKFVYDEWENIRFEYVLDDITVDNYLRLYQDGVQYTNHSFAGNGLKLDNSVCNGVTSWLPMNDDSGAWEARIYRSGSIKARCYWNVTDKSYNVMVGTMPDPSEYGEEFRIYYNYSYSFYNRSAYLLMSRSASLSGSYSVLKGDIRETYMDYVPYGSGLSPGRYYFFMCYLDDGVYRSMVSDSHDVTYKGSSRIYSDSDEYYIKAYSDRDYDYAKVLIYGDNGIPSSDMRVEIVGVNIGLLREYNVGYMFPEFQFDILIKESDVYTAYLYLYDESGKTELDNVSFTVFGYESDDDSGFVVEGEDYTLLFGFVICLIFGILGFIVTDSGLGFGSTFLGSVVLMSVPGHPLSFFPPIVLFIIGFSMILIFIAMIRS